MNTSAAISAHDGPGTVRETRVSGGSPASSCLLNSALQFADSHFSQGHLKAAHDFLSLASELAPDNVNILVTQGALQFQLGNLESARDLLTKAAELEPGNASILTKLAAVWLRLGQASAFESAISRALDMDPKDIEAQKLLAGYLLDNQCYQSAGRLYLCILQQGPDNISALLALGKCFHLASDMETAQLVYERILSLDPNHEIARTNLGIIRQKQRPAAQSHPGIPQDNS